MIKNQSPFLSIVLGLFLLASTLLAETMRIMPLGDSITSGITIDPDPIDTRIGYRAPSLGQRNNEQQHDMYVIFSKKHGTK